jgi:hypothetical protein
MGGRVRGKATARPVEGRKPHSGYRSSISGKWASGCPDEGQTPHTACQTRRRGFSGRSRLSAEDGAFDLAAARRVLQRFDRIGEACRPRVSQGSQESLS